MHVPLVLKILSHGVAMPQIPIVWILWEEICELYLIGHTFAALSNFVHLLSDHLWTFLIHHRHLVPMQEK